MELHVLNCALSEELSDAKQIVARVRGLLGRGTQDWHLYKVWTLLPLHGQIFIW